MYEESVSGQIFNPDLQIQDQDIEVEELEGLIQYDDGGFGQETPAKKRKSDILCAIDVNVPQHRRLWTESKIFGQFFDILIDQNGQMTEFVVCKKCPPPSPSTFHYKGTHNLR